MANPNHDEKGRFAEGSGGGAGGKKPDGRALRDNMPAWMIEEDAKLVAAGGWSGPKSPKRRKKPQSVKAAIKAAKAEVERNRNVFYD